MLQTFLPLFLMTFGICLFIVLMQFLWRYIDDMVGKGLGIPVLAEMFMYAALFLVPMALPLAILLASLMTFGNLGERLELLAMKSAGVSLIHIMRPLIVTLLFVSVGAFFFQNNVMPVVQVKLYTLLYSMRQKSPELDIPEGIIDTYHASFDRNAPIRERGRLFLPKQRNARCPSQAIYIIIFHAPEITGIGYSGRFILQRYSRIQCICEEKGPEGRFIKRRDDL